MSVFTHKLRNGVINATYTPVDRRGVLGTDPKKAVEVRVIIDEGGKENFTSPENIHSSSVLVYAYPQEPFNRSCVGGIIKIDSGRSFRVDGYNVSKNQRTGVIEHIELECSEQI